MKQHPLAVGIEQRVHHRQREKHGQQHGNSLPARPAAEQQIISRRANRPRDQVRRVLDQHAETNGSHKKQEIHRRVAVGKSVRSHSIPQKEKVPKWGLHKNLRQASPRAFREKRQVTVFRLWTPFAENLLRMFPMTFRGSTVHLRRLGTAGIAPFQCATRLY